MYKGNCPCHWKIRMSSPTMAEHRQFQTVREIKTSNKMDGLEANVNERGGSEHGPCLHQPCNQCPCAWMLIGLQRECRKQVYTWGRRDCQSAGGQDKNRWEGAGSDWWRCQDKNRWERLEVIVGGARTRTGERGWKWLVGALAFAAQSPQGTQASGPPARVEGPSGLPVPCASRVLGAVTAVVSSSLQPHGL